MTLIRFDVRDLTLGGDEPAARGEVSVTYRDGSGAVSTYKVDGARLVFAREIRVAFHDGVLDEPADVPATIPDEMYARITVENITLGRRLVSRNVIIPDTDAVDFGDLVIVDPKTFTPVVLTPTLLETITTVALEATRDRF